MPILTHWGRVNSKLNQASKFEIECTCPSGKWIVKITSPNAPFTCHKAKATYLKIRNMQSSIEQVLRVFHLSDCHFFYSSQMIGRVKFRNLLTIIDSDNGLSPGRHQAIIWITAGLLIESLRTNLSEICIKIFTFLFMKMHLKCSLENGSHFVSASMC